MNIIEMRTLDGDKWQAPLIVYQRHKGMGSNAQALMIMGLAGISYNSIWVQPRNTFQKSDSGPNQWS